MREREIRAERSTEVRQSPQSVSVQKEGAVDEDTDARKILQMNCSVFLHKATQKVGNHVTFLSHIDCRGHWRTLCRANIVKAL